MRVELYEVKRTRFVRAHSNALAALALSLDGKLLATASEKGTLIRIHNTSEGTRLQVGWLMPVTSQGEVQVMEGWLLPVTS